MSGPRIAVVDYGMGNIHSIVKALRLFSDNVEFTSDSARLKSAHALVLPGDGAFAAAMRNLEGSLSQIIHLHVSSGKPLFGICIGFQVLFEDSNEVPGDKKENRVNIKGLGLLPGKVRRFNSKKKSFVVPHMGWNTLLHGRDMVADYNGEYMYFVHSYRVTDVPDEFVLASCDYGGVTFPAVVGYKNIFATQFHPEKSAKMGLLLLEKWVKSITP